MAGRRSGRRAARHRCGHRLPRAAWCRFEVIEHEATRSAAAEARAVAADREATARRWRCMTATATGSPSFRRLERLDVRRAREVLGGASASGSRPRVSCSGTSGPSTSARCPPFGTARLPEVVDGGCSATRRSSARAASSGARADRSGRAAADHGASSRGHLRAPGGARRTELPWFQPTYGWVRRYEKRGSMGSIVLIGTKGGRHALARPVGADAFPVTDLQDAARFGVSLAVGLVLSPVWGALLFAILALGVLLADLLADDPDQPLPLQAAAHAPHPEASRGCLRILVVANESLEGRTSAQSSWAREAATRADGRRAGARLAHPLRDHGRGPRDEPGAGRG